ncbi:unnamed protein product [Prunus armeniaca]
MTHELFILYLSSLLLGISMSYISFSLKACANVGMMVVNSGLNCKNCEIECEGQVTPEVTSKLKSKLGLEFDCCDDVFNFYNMYAVEARFGIWCSTTRTCTLTGEVTRKEYVCCKQGYALTSPISRKRRRRGCTRTSCKVKLAILKVKAKNKYIVVGFNEVHNHDMTTVDKVHLLRSHRNLTESTNVYSADMSKVNIPVIGHNAELLKEHFVAMQEKNESFYFKMEEIRKEGWVMFSGVNNHRQTVLFGCIFLTTETTNSFVWLFEEFKKAMPGEPPKIIITHQDAAMSKAIAVTLSTTFHRYCIWHILNKIIEKPGIGECFLEMCKMHIGHKELMADHVDNNEKPPLPFQTPMQHQMGLIYTRKILEMFEKEDFRSLLCLFELVEQNETHCRYKVSEPVNPGVTRMKELVHDKDADKAYCTCKGFEFWGILCSILKNEAARPAIFKGRFLPIPATNSSNNGSVRTTTLPSSSLSPPQSAAVVPENSQETGGVGQLFRELSSARSPSSGHRFKRVSVGNSICNPRFGRISG